MVTKKQQGQRVSEKQQATRREFVKKAAYIAPVGSASICRDSRACGARARTIRSSSTAASRELLSAADTRAAIEAFDWVPLE